MAHPEMPELVNTETDAERLDVGASSAPPASDSLCSCKSSFLAASHLQKLISFSRGRARVRSTCSIRAGLLPPAGFLSSFSELFALDLSLTVSSPPGLSVPGSLLLALDLVSQAPELFHLG